MLCRLYFCTSQLLLLVATWMPADVLRHCYDVFECICVCDGAGPSTNGKLTSSLINCYQPLPMIGTC